MSKKEIPESDNKPIVKYEVLSSKKYGRYLVAGKKISAGEIIIREKPVVIGPTILINNNHLCFECLRAIPKCATKGNSDLFCSSCQVAVFCCVVCKKRKFSHTIEECKILKNKTIFFNVNDILLPLRLWLIKKKDEKLWEKILRLEAHLEARRNGPLWEINEKMIVNTLKSLGIVDKSEENNFSELLHQIGGILDVNSVGVPSPGGSDDFALRGLYLEASLMAHDCRGNTFSTIDDEFQLTIYASKPIDAGELILAPYVSAFLGMAERRRILREGKYFECDCPMCEDPYELGTNLSTMFCPYCSDGLITFTSETTKNPYVEEKNWKCNKCQISLSGYLIAFYLYLVNMRIKPIEKSIKELEVLLKELSSTFHPNHFLMLDIKNKLSLLYIEEIINNSNSLRENLNRKMEIDTEILNILEITTPGISVTKGIRLYDTYSAIFHLANLNYSTGEIAPKKFVEQWEKTMKYLKRALKMLQYAPATSSDGIIAKIAFQKYKFMSQYRNTINKFKNK